MPFIGHRNVYFKFQIKNMILGVEYLITGFHLTTA